MPTKRSSDRLLAINWRAHAAEPFYAATPRDPRGITLRRRFDIEDDRVRGFVDERLARENEDHLAEAIIEDIARQRVGEMRQIIATITPEQYDTIKEDPVPALVVQGGPGTGKTAVGLHRAAWLLYAHPTLRAAGVLVVGPNRTFIRYIGQVLPSLGEQSVELDVCSRSHPELPGWTLALPCEASRAVGRTRDRAVAPSRGGLDHRHCHHRQEEPGLPATCQQGLAACDTGAARAGPLPEPPAAQGGGRRPGQRRRNRPVAVILRSGQADRYERDGRGAFRRGALADRAHHRTFGHVVIDEAQNLTAMELRMVIRRARRKSLTVLGDIAQRTAQAGVSTWAKRASRCRRAHVRDA
ncbi:MAG: AAA family ATPase [Solirubrobacterales bacterium]|nr:AAA family ATPase [Solirubrobacterales bacterium]